MVKKLNEMNFSQMPNKLPPFLMKIATKCVDEYLSELRTQLEKLSPEEVIEEYRLTDMEGSDSWAYRDNIEHQILKTYENSDIITGVLFDDPAKLIQAIKSIPSRLLSGQIYFTRLHQNKSISDFRSFTAGDFAEAISNIALGSVLKQKEQEIEDLCDTINDYIEEHTSYEDDEEY